MADNDPQDEQVGSETAAEVLLRSLAEHGVKYLFSNYGTDHTPLLEAAARIREESPEALPENIICPHETVALSAAHGYAALTGEPQAVIVHVDVGTQNLGGMVHDAHRGDAPVFIFSGLAPVSEGDHPGSRDNVVHYLQDVYDQPGILREYCRWSTEYKPPVNPDEVVARGLERATAPRKGPVYVTATREALETPLSSLEQTDADRSQRHVRMTGADSGTVSELADLLGESDTPLVITSKLGLHTPDSSVRTLVEFAEAAGAGVVEYSPAALCFPRDHELHAGFDPTRQFENADLILAVDVDVPWLPHDGRPDSEIPTVQIDVDPTKPTYPKWDFRFDHTINADPERTLAALTDEIDESAGAAGRERWRAVHSELAEERKQLIDGHRDADRLTPEVLSDSLNQIVDESTVVIDEAVTNSYGAVRPHVTLSEPGSYFAAHGSGLGWGSGAAIGAKLAEPDNRVVSVIGDGSYVFSNPTAAGWVEGVYDAPTLTVVYNNSGWNAVRAATLRDHPDGRAASTSIPESEFSPSLDLTHAAKVADAHTTTIASTDELDEKLREAVDAVDNGTPAVVDVKIEPVGNR